MVVIVKTTMSRCAEVVLKLKSCLKSAVKSDKINTHTTSLVQNGEFIIGRGDRPDWSPWIEIIAILYGLFYTKQEFNSTNRKTGQAYSLDF